MAIQNRRGIYSDFDPTKMVEGEFAVVQSGDPNTSDGKAVYIAPTTGTAERVALYKDVTQAVSTAIDEVTEDVIEDINEGVAENVERAETAADNAEASAEEAAEILENKADIDGTYDNLVVGNLLSDAMQTDTAPYLFRPTGGGLQRIGERSYPVLVGASVAENQLVQNGDFADSSTWSTFNSTLSISNGIATLTASQSLNPNMNQRVSIPSGHKSLLMYEARGSASGNISYYINDGGSRPNVSVSANVWTDVYTIRNATQNATMLYLYTAEVEGYVLDVRNVQIIDLTAMFGSTIADYAYTLEQATAGSGIAWLRSYGLLGGYQAHNAGSIESVEVTGKKVVGFNQWNEEWKVINDHIGSKNPIPCLPNTTYYMYAPQQPSNGLRFWTSDMVQTGSTRWNIGQFTTPSDCCFMTFEMTSAYGTTYNHDICINLSNPDRNGEYEAYTSQSYDYGTDTLNGIFKLDASNNLYADGDVKTSDGTITRKYYIKTVNGSESWTKSASYPGNYYLSFGATGGKLNSINIITSNGLEPISTLTELVQKDMVILFDGGLPNPNINIKNASMITLDDFKGWLSNNPITIVYELNTPTTEQSTPFTSPQIVYPGGTEEFVTETGVPVGHETKYPYDLKGLVEGLIDVPDVPSTNGTYTLKATRSASGITYTWVSE